MGREKVPLKLPEGVNRSASPADSSGAWYETNLIRWVNEKLQPIGGYADLDVTFPDLASTARYAFTWADNNGVVRTALICDRNAYVVSNGALLDITPADGLAFNDGTNPGGYGTGLYGTGLYGTARPAYAGLASVGKSFRAENYGEDLLFMTSDDGRLLIWGTHYFEGVARPVVGAPSGRTFLVTPERYVMVFGYDGDTRRFGWNSLASLDNGPADWDISDVLGTAGDYFVESAAIITSVYPVKQGTLFFTARYVYLVTYSALPYIYTYTRKGDRAYPISASALAGYGDGSAVWLSDNGFWLYNNGSVVTLPSPLFGWFKANCNFARAKETVFAVNIAVYPEVYWFFPSKGSQENDTYIVWNYRSNWWAMGKLRRTCGVGSAYTNPPMLTDTKRVYVHETGVSYADVNDRAYAISASFTVGRGHDGTLVQANINNDGLDETAPLYSLYSKESRMNTSSNAESVEGLVSIDGVVDFMLTGRDFQLKLESPDNANNAWTFGENLLLFKPRGTR